MTLSMESQIQGGERGISLLARLGKRSESYIVIDQNLAPVSAENGFFAVIQHLRKNTVWFTSMSQSLSRADSYERRSIRIYGARQHNLKNFDLSIPRDALVVITGPSGSGKSSLAFDTLYAEGQRRYVESLSAYARQFLDQMQKPDVERIDGLSPAIAIEQRSAGGSPRSIVATTTEIYDYLRLLYAHVGHPHCPRCGQPVSGQSPQKICDHILALPAGWRMMLLAPYVQGRKGEHREVFERMRREGHVRVRVDGKIQSLDDEDDLQLRKTVPHQIEAVVDRLVSGEIDPVRLTDSVERALRCGGGLMIVLRQDPDSGEWVEEKLSEHLACADCSLSFGELLPRNFSFNSPYGACPNCHGLGSQERIDPERVVEPDKSLEEGAFPLWRTGPRRLVQYYRKLMKCVARHYNVSLETPFKKIPSTVQQKILFGSGEEDILFSFRWGGRNYRAEKPFEGVIPNLMRRYAETESESLRERLRRVMTRHECTVCHGARLRPESLAVTVGGMNLPAFIRLSVQDAQEAVRGFELEGEEAIIAADLLREIQSRLGFLDAVGLSYLSLDRASNTLSGGEAQRIRLATQLGSGLVGVLYILDEPSIGLHQRDNHRLLQTLFRLRDAGNTVVVVEHDLDTILAADHVVDLGPGAGEHGGRVVAAGTVEDIRQSTESLTGQYLRGERRIPLPASRQAGNGHFLRVVEAQENNLHHLSVSFPLGTFTCVTGVSGSGKSTLVNQILIRAINRHFGVGREVPGRHKRVEGLAFVDKMIVVDQSPIGRTPRSNPATYTDAFGVIRNLFAKLPESKARGYKPGRFSFNVKGGRCEDCRGDGIKKIEMQFLPDVYVNCETCKGKRYNRDTLSVFYRGCSIADVLEMTCEEACEFFSAIPRLHRILQTLVDVGLGYIHLGQPATTLSGGEAQRVKLATELARPSRGHTLYILDEPTTGLHLHDIHKLLTVLRSLRDQGNTVLVIEHNMDVIKTADHIIDLGPEGGDAGGRLVVAGTPEEVAACSWSHTGSFLAQTLKAEF